ncbi:2OG-Fe dioxygenase family protein [Spirillospora sp. CA-294931]|uniref:2OG-Fe dioxygenase family protein n=1 Tax=Spirillospora sp. CA-294931 TaxID=3240042 RepID=UPI003D8C45B0
MKATDLARKLHEDGHITGNLNTELGLDFTQSRPWQDLGATWNRLPQDRYMADGGTYRQRRYSEFTCASGRAALLPHREFYQSADINALNGGVVRHFDAFEPGTSANDALHRVLAWSTAILDALHGPSNWLAQCFQNRTLARKKAPGLPTPEGKHRDGADYNMVLLVRRASITGATNTVYDSSGGPIRTLLLSEPGDFLINDDRRTMHDATPISLLGTAPEGHRDAFVVSFTRNSVHGVCRR